MAIKKEEGWIYIEEKIMEYFLENFQELYQWNYLTMSPEIEEVGKKVISEEENGRIT